MSLFWRHVHIYLYILVQDSARVLHCKYSNEFTEPARGEPRAPQRSLAGTASTQTARVWRRIRRARSFCTNCGRPCRWCRQHTRRICRWPRRQQPRARILLEKVQTQRNKTTERIGQETLVLGEVLGEENTEQIANRVQVIKTFPITDTAPRSSSGHVEVLSSQALAMRLILVRCRYLVSQRELRVSRRAKVQSRLKET